MLSDFPIAPTIPVTDLSRAREFYEVTLGLTVQKESESGITLQAGDGTALYLYKRPPSKADHTLAAFQVTDIEKTVEELTSRGVKFEHYDFPGLKTDERGIAELPGENEKAAWFKDPDGNILGIGEEIK